MTRLAVTLALVLSSLQARAEDAESARLRAAATRYFASENLYNGLYLGIGATNVGIGSLLATRDDAGLRAAGYPVIAVGGIELVVGAVYLGLTPGWRREAIAELDRDTSEFLLKQRARLRGVESGFKYYEITDGVAAAAGLGIGIGGAASGKDAIAGAGAGLGAVAFAQLTMDLITHEVAKRYLAALEHARVGLGPARGTLGIALSF